MQTIAMKLVSGEEVIARSIEHTTDAVTVSHVRTIGLQQANAQGDVGIGMMDYILSNKDVQISINRSAIVATFDMAPEVERAYLSNTSGIQLA